MDITPFRPLVLANDRFPQHGRLFSGAHNLTALSEGWLCPGILMVQAFFIAHSQPLRV